MFRLAPAPRDGETLYSVLARLGQYLNANGAAPLMHGLMGRRSAIAATDLPGGLAELLRDIAVVDREAAIDRVIDRLTSFRFHTAFMPIEVRDRVRLAMRGDVTGVYTSLGLATFKVRPTTRLRFCPTCLAEMESDGRDPWWRLDHQLPGAVLCARHGVPLRLSSVDPGGGNRHSFVAAARANCRASADPEIDGLDMATLALLWDLSRLAAGLLREPPEALEHADRAERYRARLHDVGLMRSARRVDVTALHAAFRERWGSVPDMIPGLSLGDNQDHSWLVGMVRSGRRAAHPLQHLMLDAMLSNLAPVELDRPFGTGPWVCRNPAAGHHGQPVVDEVTMRRDRGAVYGDFACACGYLYTVGRSAEGVIGQPRYRRFGPLLASALVAAIARGESLRGTAASLGLDPKTLMREAAMAGVAVPWSLQPSGVIPASPPAKPEVTRGNRQRRRRPVRNWFAIDVRMARAAAAAALAIRAQHPPVRVTFAEIERRVARRDWITKRRAKLPQTVEAIQRAAEGVDNFRQRRIEACVAAAVAAGDLRPCEVLRAAGLNSSWLPRVRMALDLAVSNRRMSA